MGILITHLWDVLLGKNELRRSRRRRSVKPGLEWLEDRTLLSTYTWNGTTLWAGGDLASNPANWSGLVAGNPPPGASDTILFNDTDTAPCTIDAAFGGTVKALSIEATYNNTVTLNRDLKVTANAQIQGDKLDGSGNLLIGDSPVGPPQFAATLLWNGGELAGTVGSNVTIGSGSTANIIGNAGLGLTLIGRSLVNNGTVTWTTVSNLFLQASAQVIDNGVMNINTSSTVAINSNHDNTTGIFVNPGAQLNLNVPTNGVFAPGPGELDVDTTLVNKGTVNINQGSIHALFNSRNQGTYNIQDGTTLSLFSGVHVLDGSLGPNTSQILGGGDVIFNVGATIQVVGTASVTNVDDSADLVDHTANSTLLVYGTYYWRLGKWGGSGQTSIAHGANLTLRVNGTGAYALESVLANHSTVTWSKAADINVANGGSIVNDLNAVFDIQTDQTIFKGAGAGTFINAGTLQKSQGTGVTRIKVQYIPIGGGNDKELGTGTIAFALFVSLLNNVEVDPGGTIAYDGGVEQVAANVLNNGTITAFGDYLFNAGTFTMSNGALTAEGSSTMSEEGWTPGNFVIAAGAVFSGYGYISANVFNASEVDVTNGGAQGDEMGPLTLAVYGNYTQTAGATNLNGNVLSVAGVQGTGGVEQDGGTVADNGTISVVGDYLQNGGTFALTAATLDANNLNIAAGADLSGAGTINANVTNAGEIDATSNTLFITRAFDQTAGATMVETGATLFLFGDAQQNGGNVVNDGTLQSYEDYFENGGALTMSAGLLAVANLHIAPGASFTGDGSIVGNTLGGGNIYNAGAVYGDANRLAIAGTYTQTGGSTDVASLLTVGGAVQQSGGLISVEGMLTTPGVYNETGGTLLLSNAVLNANGLQIGVGAVLDGSGSISADASQPDSTAFTGGIEQDAGSVADAGTIGAAGDYLLNAGAFTLTGGALAAANASINAGAIFSGYGIVSANVVNFGEFDTLYEAPSPLYILGAYTEKTGAYNGVPTGVTNVNYGDTLNVAGLVDVRAGVVNVDSNGSNLIAQASFTQEGGLVDLNVGTITVTGVYAESGLTTLEAGTLIASGNPYGVEVTGSARLCGYGAIFAGVLNASEIDPQSGTLAVIGLYTQTAGVTNIVSGATLSVTGLLDEQNGLFNLSGGNLHVDNGYLSKSKRSQAAAFFEPMWSTAA